MLAARFTRVRHNLQKIQRADHAAEKGLITFRQRKTLMPSVERSRRLENRRTSVDNEVGAVDLFFNTESVSPKLHDHDGRE